MAIRLRLSGFHLVSRMRILLPIFTILAVLTLGATLSTKGAAPDTAETVLVKQLTALKENDSKGKDSGIRTAWRYAHPNNQRSTGPVERFTRMLKSPAYRPLLNHDSHRVALSQEASGTAVYRVTVFTQTSAPLIYTWVLEKVESGARKGEWATTIVSPPVTSGSPPA